MVNSHLYASLALSVLLTLYSWAMPYNLRLINELRDGFRVRIIKHIRTALSCE